MKNLQDKITSLKAKRQKMSWDSGVLFPVA